MYRLIGVPCAYSRKEPSRTATALYGLRVPPSIATVPPQRRARLDTALWPSITERATSVPVGYAIRRDSSAIRVQECQDLAVDRLNGRHNHRNGRCL